MPNTCLNCGKPLGGEATLCYSCRENGISPADIDCSDEDLRERVERYFIISSIKCVQCNEIHGTVTVDDEEYTAADFGIDTLEEWRLEMDKEEAWLRENRGAVEGVLPRLESEWPQSVRALRTHVL